MERNPSRHVTVHAHDLDRDDVFIELVTEVLAGFYCYMHFGTPCASWSALSRINGSSRRLPEMPSGVSDFSHLLVGGNPADGVRPLRYKEYLSLEQADRMSTLCLLIHERGGLFTIENPSASLLFWSTPVLLLMTTIATFSVQFDQCTYGLRPPAAGPPEYIRKSTKILANFGRIRSLERRCAGTSASHLHIHALGTRRVADGEASRCVSVANWASRYPASLCAALAACVQAELADNTTRL